MMPLGSAAAMGAADRRAASARAAAARRILAILARMALLLRRFGGHVRPRLLRSPVPRRAFGERSDGTRAAPIQSAIVMERIAGSGVQSSRTVARPQPAVIGWFRGAKACRIVARAREV